MPTRLPAVPLPMATTRTRMRMRALSLTRWTLTAPARARVASSTCECWYVLACPIASHAAGSSDLPARLTIRFALINSRLMYDTCFGPSPALRGHPLPSPCSLPAKHCEPQADGSDHRARRRSVGASVRSNRGSALGTDAPLPSRPSRSPFSSRIRPSCSRPTSRAMAGGTSTSLLRSSTRSYPSLLSISPRATTSARSSWSSGGGGMRRLVGRRPTSSLRP